MRRHEARQCALQALYQMDVGKTDSDHALTHVLECQNNVTDRDVEYIRHLVDGTWESVEDVDGILRAHVEGWSLERIARIDLNVLRMAVFELQNETDVDVATIVDEAVELAKTFSTDASSKFVNGVLAKVLPSLKSRRS